VQHGSCATVTAEMLSHSVGTTHRAQLIREIPQNWCYEVSKKHGLRMMKEKHTILEDKPVGQAFCRLNVSQSADSALF
jgi:hypothetical protein